MENNLMFMTWKICFKMLLLPKIIQKINVTPIEVAVRLYVNQQPDSKIYIEDKFLWMDMQL